MDLGAKGKFLGNTANICLMTQLNLPCDNTLTIYSGHYGEFDMDAIIILLVSLTQIFIQIQH